MLPQVHMMAGKRAAHAYRAFNLTSNAPIREGDTVTVQMEVSIIGYWAKLTRTFFAKTISDEWQKAHLACMEVQDAALQVIEDGICTRRRRTIHSPAWDNRKRSPNWRFSWLQTQPLT